MEQQDMLRAIPKVDELLGMEPLQALAGQTPAPALREAVREELEALRLCDLEALDQDAAAGRMEVSRGTLQRILYAARHKTAEALVRGRALKIEGGHYAVQGQPGGCAAGCQYCRFCQIVPDKGEHTHESNT